MKLLNNDLTHSNYYNDTEYISNSMLNNISVSPEYFRFRQDNPQPATAPMKLGSAIHMNVLQEFNKHYAVSPKFDKRTKAGKEDYAEFSKKHMFKDVISESDFHIIEQITMKLMKDRMVKALLQQGEPEKIIQWNNEHYDINCKGMLDYYREGADMIIDLKTTQDASYNGFMRSVRKYKYHKQAAFYLDAVKAQRFIIIAVEKTPPFSINIFEMGDDIIDEGRDMYNHELESYKYCEENDYWPGAGFDPLDKDSERTIHILENKQL